MPIGELASTMPDNPVRSGEVSFSVLSNEQPPDPTTGMYLKSQQQGFLVWGTHEEPRP